MNSHDVDKKKFIDDKGSDRKRAWAITHFLKENESLEDYKTFILEFIKDYDNVKIAIGEIEKTNTYKEHCHVVLYFPNKMTFQNLKFYFLNDHIEAVRYFNDYCIYLQKEGLYFSNLEFKRSVDIYDSFVQDLQNGFTKRELMLKYPKLFLFHFDNITKMLELYYDNN